MPVSNKTHMFFSKDVNGLKDGRMDGRMRPFQHYFSHIETMIE